MKLLVYLFLFISSVTFSQEEPNLSIKNNVLLINENPCGKVIIEGNKAFLFHESKTIQYKYGYDFQKIANELYPDKKIKIRVDEYILYPPIRFTADSIFIDNKYIGRQHHKKVSGTWYIQINLYEKHLTTYNIDYIKHKGYKYWSSILSSTFITFSTGISLGATPEEGKQVIKYLELYHTIVSYRLSVSKDPKEGIYKSIDKGEKYEYDIVILEDLYNLGNYNAYVWSSTDQELTPSFLLFSFSKTAIKDKYIASYSLKSGENEGNKLATFDEGILNMDVKSFIKMYPTNDDKDTYQEIVPNTVTGSGFFIHESGIIATNHHVIEGAKTIDILIKNDNESYIYKADIILSDEQNDVAILKINDENFTPLKNIPYKLNSNTDIGEKCFTIGFPMISSMGINQKLTDGIVSSKTGYKDNSTQYQISVPIQPGNSGGALFDENGDVIGLTSSGISSLQNVGYAIKISYLIALYNQLTEKPQLSLGESNSDKNLKDSYQRVKDYVCLIKVKL